MNVLQGLLVVLVLLKLGDCFEFIQYGDNPLNVNDTEEAIIKWKFRRENSPEYTINCGFYEGIKIKEIVRKIGNGPVTFLPGVTGISQADKYTESDDDTVIGIKIRSARKSDPTNYGCTVGFKPTASEPIATKTSDIVKLVIYDRPNMAQCLTTPFPTTMYNGDLSIQCSVTGNPEPKLQCHLLDNNMRVLSSLPQGGPRPNNVTEDFTRISEYARYVRCVADGDGAGTEEKLRELTVRHKPFAPKNFSQIGSASDTIRIRWMPIPRNESGDTIKNYIVNYYVSSIGQLNLTTKTLNEQPSGSDQDLFQRDGDFFTYEIRELSNALEYTVYVYGKNQNGDGQHTEKKRFSPGFKPETDTRSGGSDDNLGAIVGGVIGGVVLLALIVILVVWCSRKEKKPAKSGYPTSYVEDAVDYPPASGENLYANSKKKQDNYDYDGDGYPLKGPTSNSYDHSEKAYV